MRNRAVATVVTMATLAAVGCSSGSGPAGSGNSRPGRSGGASAAGNVSGTAVGPNPGYAVFGSIPDTSGNRQLMVSNNLSGLWHSAGLPTVPSASQLQHTTVGRDLLAGIVLASPLGPDALVATGAADGPGYNSLAARFEVAAGLNAQPLAGTTGVAYLSVPVSASEVGTAVRKVGGKDGPPVGGARVFDVSNTEGLTAPEQYAQLLMGLAYVAAPTAGGAVASAASGPGTSVSTIAALATRAHVAHSLASDPVIHEFMAQWPDALSTVMGTTLMIQANDILRDSVSPSTLHSIEAKAGISRIPVVASFGGWCYLAGPPSSATLGAAVYYRTHANAENAARLLGGYLRTGYSYSMKKPYSDLLQVQSVAAVGNLLVARMRQLVPGALRALIAKNDFPLFWTPSYLS